MVYVKLFSSILASTIWGEADATRILWITMLAMADRYGYVGASTPGLAHAARIPIAECQRGLAVLTSPDSHSRTTDHDGRRIEATEGGWNILNYESYRLKASADERREKQRERMRRYRSRSAEASPESTSAQCDDKQKQKQKQKQNLSEPSEAVGAHAICAQPIENPEGPEGWVSQQPDAGPDGSEGGPNPIAKAILATSWRDSSKARAVEVFRIAARLEREGMPTDGIAMLWGFARMVGRNPGAYFDRVLSSEASWREALTRCTARSQERSR